MVDPTHPRDPQALVLQSVLTGRPLPGTRSPVRPADLALATDSDGTVRVLDAGLSLAATELVAAAHTPARLVTEAWSVVPGAGHGVCAVLRVRGAEPVAHDADRVRVGVEVCAPGNGRFLPLGVTMVLLRRDGHGWAADEPPTQLAT